MNNLETTLTASRRASLALLEMSDEKINSILVSIADALEANADSILEANAKDLARLDPENPLYDRLQLTHERITSIAGDMRNVALLESPVGRVLGHRVLPNGLDLRKVSVPFGVVGVIYEARPNVTYDVTSLCLKSGNACVLKGGKDALDTNKASIGLIHRVLAENGLPEACVTLLTGSHGETEELLKARGLVDLIIPRGGRRLIEAVRNNARVPVIETGAGVCHAYFDATGDKELGAKVIHNAKTRRVSVCNALDCLVVHSSRLSDLPDLCHLLGDDRVKIYADTRAYEALAGSYPSDYLLKAVDESFGSEFLSMAMAVKAVDSLEEAIAHVNRYGSGHSETIITADDDASNRFGTMVDAACVYTNAPTSWTDGAQFGLGAEIGISTQKLHARGPMALDELNTYKWLISGNGQLRPR